MISGVFTSTSSSHILSTVRIYFKDEPALHAYLCRREDSLQMIALATKGRLINVRHISKSTEVIQDISIGEDSAHRKGIFVDMRCPAGQSIVRQVTGMFNESFTWLLWTDSPVAALRILQDSRVSVDSRLAIARAKGRSAELMDVYRLHVKGSFIVTDVTVSGDDDSNFWNSRRRNNFNGYKFKAATVVTEFQFRGREDEEKFMDPNYLQYVAGFRRYGYAMLYILSMYYNFDFEMKVHNKWHTIYPNGTATGMLRDLISGEKDFGMAPSKFIGERLKLVSFLAGLGSVKFFLVFRQPVALGSVNALIAPMSFSAWMSLFGACAVCGLTLWVLLMRDSSVTEPYKWNESVLITLTSIAQQSTEFTGRNLASRLALLTLLILTFIANLMYNTSVLNGLLIKAPDAIQNPLQLLASDLKISCNNVGYLRDQMATNDSLTISFREKLLKSDEMYVNIQKGIKLVKSGKYAFYVLDDDFYRGSSTMLSVEEICSTSNLQKERSFPAGVYGVQSSPYREHFRLGVTYFREIGILPYLSKAFRASKPECSWSLEAEPFGLKPLSLAYFVFLTGLLASLLMLSVECAARILTRTKTKTQNPQQERKDSPTA
ncbi:hypothetical protein GE061_003805 [Apolygus lucorum]|uniref:Ionotropic glutamate receptor C-terminal domain-containing protein n=1 Tax=Apolygus lucorum TaxID=248454 RepID=A0A8S9X5P7_APOLU|nr:hypothetical protein GE061_003805 [Apolygus lucorum]